MRTLVLALPALVAADVVNRGPVPRDNFRADAVKEAFFHAWDGYYEYAFPHDELHPISNGYGDSRNSWGASAVDALSTAIMMRNATIVNQILDHIAAVDYSQTETAVSLFETTIRYLAGMLSGYDLLKGPASDLVDQGKVDVLLEQSRNLADVLKFAFDTPSGVPHNMVNITSHENDGAQTNGLAVTGTLVLEWTRLSDLTGDGEYARLSQRAEEYLLHPEPAEYEPFPGLVGSSIYIENGTFADGEVSWSGGADSYYEYLIKMYLYDPERFSLYGDRWVAAAESSIEHLASHPSTREDLTFLATYTEAHELGLVSQHLTCFDGGSFLLGGTVLDRQDFVDFGLDLVAGCHETYNATLTGIGPEQFSWDPSRVPEDQQELFERAGFYIQDGAYILRPEVIESFYYAWRITGDETYRHWIWSAFTNINTYCRTGSGFAGLENVNAENGGGRQDNQESFLFAEVLKYTYLAFAPEDEWQVQRGSGNTFVYNTEAHPFKVYTPQ
ncbi:mannosyl-oligosaccharide alpha-1,2-mannosidase 1B [Aspergillus aurantiobrunneus]